MTEATSFTYAEVPGTACGNGTVAGVGLSPQTGSDTLVVVMNGGGASWDTFTCFALNAATHPSTTYNYAADGPLRDFVQDWALGRPTWTTLRP